MPQSHVMVERLRCLIAQCVEGNETAVISHTVHPTQCHIVHMHINHAMKHTHTDLSDAMNTDKLAAQARIGTRPHTRTETQKHRDTDTQTQTDTDTHTHRHTHTQTHTHRQHTQRLFSHIASSREWYV